MLTQCDLYKSSCASELKPRNKGIDLLTKYPKLAFPSGAVELKTAWKVLTKSEEDGKTFYTTRGYIQPKKGASSCELVTLGLVGIHIVSATPQNPEFVWATFEHRNNAPDCTDLKARPPLGGKWSLFDPARCDNCPTNQFNPGRPAQVCRMHPWGNPVGSVDGQVYFLDYSFVNSPPGYTQFADDLVSMQVYQPMTSRAPTWTGDVKRVLEVYGFLYPIMSRFQLGDYAPVVKNAAMIRRVLELEMEQPLHMPATRDLSDSRRDMILRWMDAGMPE